MGGLEEVDLVGLVDSEFEDEDGEISKKSNARMSIAFYLITIKRTTIFNIPQR